LGPVTETSPSATSVRGSHADGVLHSRWPSVAVSTPASPKTWPLLTELHGTTPCQGCRVASTRSGGCIALVLFTLLLHRGNVMYGSSQCHTGPAKTLAIALVCPNPCDCEKKLREHAAVFWTHRVFPCGFSSEEEPPSTGICLCQCEWQHARKSTEQRWTRHVWPLVHPWQTLMSQAVGTGIHNVASHLLASGCMQSETQST
jgi:hypothetical protein